MVRLFCSLPTCTYVIAIKSSRSWELPIKILLRARLALTSVFECPFMILAPFLQYFFFCGIEVCVHYPHTTLLLSL